MTAATAIPLPAGTPPEGDPVPPVLHRIWLDDPMPPEFADHGRRWAEAHPGWQLWDWRSRDELPTLQQRPVFDRARDLFPPSRGGWDWKRFEADLLRLELLRRYGGVYVDTDTVPRAPLGPLLHGRLGLTGKTCLVGRSPQHSGGHHPLTNAVMAAAPGDAWIGELVDRLPEAVAEYAGRPLAQMVGPWHLTRVYERHGPWPSVTVLPPRQLFREWVHHQWNSAARRRGRGVW